MPLRDRLKRFQGQLKDKFTSGDGPAGSDSYLPLAQPSPFNPLPEADNPTSARPKLDPKESAWKCLNNFRQVLAGIANGVGPLKLVVDELGEMIGVCEDAVAARSDYAALRAELEEIFGILSVHFAGNTPPTMTAGMNNLCTTIKNELDRVSLREERSLVRRYLEAKNDPGNVMKCYRRIQNHLERIKVGVIRYHGVGVELTNLKLNADLSMWKIVDEQISETRLKSLAPSMSACYDSAEALQVGRRACTPETRKEVLANLSRWRRNKAEGNMYWLNGMAGTGKTTIANSLCAMLDRSHELGASFFCTRLLPECRNVKLILPTIAYQLARFSRPFYHALSATLQTDPDLHTKALPIQLQGLIIEPLRKATKALPEDFVVVIDALDECDDSQAIGLLLEVLANNASELPMKVFVSSRPEPQIREKIGDTKDKLILHELESSIVKEDIKLYLRNELIGLPTSIGDAEFNALVERAGVLFIYAATVVRYIKSVSSPSRRHKRVREVLEMDCPRSPSADKDIDSLYSAILTSAFASPELNDMEIKAMKLVLDTVVCAQEPLTVSALAELLRLDDQTIAQDALEPLWSVLHISGSDSLVTTLHTSFPDYMLDPARSKQLGCQGREHHGQLAELCFVRIDSNECQLNICRLESSYLFDEQVPDLEERVRFAIPQDLWYACRYWAVHLECGGPSIDRLHKVEEFVNNQLLLWMEVLNLKKQMDAGAMIMEMAERWCKGVKSTLNITDLVHDAWRFVTVFATNNVSRSTPHLYVSMLASWPKTGSLACCHGQRIQGLTRVEGTGMARRRLALLGILNARSPVYSTAFSPDSTQIVCGTDDGTIQVWDALNGKLVLDSFEGHTDPVQSVGFSPDGMRIISGAIDNIILVWDAQTGKRLLDPLKGHTGWVYSVTFSPDGRNIVSGSGDNTIQLWDAQNGKPLLGPLEGHTGSVRSVAFSPDGARIVSGSDDKRVRLWDAQTGKLLLNPLQGHINSVWSVTFSPDGMNIASGSDDRTIRVWHSRTGVSLDPLTGHNSSVRSVAFSPDNMRIVSGSDDWTILVWDAQTGQQLLQPLEGHTHWVRSVSFSSNGMHIASGSNDGTIRIWDAQTLAGMSPLDSFNGHDRQVSSIAFSSDSMRIVSGSDDNTIRVWDAQTGRLLLDPLEGHSQSVILIEFSVDGKRILSGSNDWTIRVWDAQTGKPLLGPLDGHAGLVTSIAFSPDSTRIISGSSDHTIRSWDTQTGEPLLQIPQAHNDWVRSAVFSPDGMRIVSGSDDKIIRVWDAQTGKPLLGPLEGHTHWVRSVAFSPNGMRLASGSRDLTIRVWDAQTGELLVDPLVGHTDSVRLVAFSLDGARIISSSDDNTIRVWDSQTGDALFEPLKAHADWLSLVAISPDGTRAVSGSADTAIRVWNLEGLIPLPKPNEKLSHSPSCSWELGEHGWIIDEYQRPLLWLPPDLRDRVVLPHMLLLIANEGSVTLDFSEAKLGESWTGCYVPGLRI